MDNFETVPDERIMEGEATDAYFLRTEEALEEANENPEVVAEISADQFSDGDFEVFAGLNEATKLLEGLPIDVDALPEGSFFDGGPVMQITGTYRDFARYETALLGFLSQASGMATAANEVMDAANDEVSVLSFGARHIHPTIGPMLERSAYIAGCGGYSYVGADEYLPDDPVGTMPHALILSFGQNRQADAFKAFDEGVPEDVSRIALCDTFSDEVEEVRTAVETLGDSLDGVRLDTTSSRRGDFKRIIREVQWELNEMGRSDVDVYVSGGINPDQIQNLRGVIDGVGVGSYISNANPVDFGLDIVVRDGEPLSKRGKLSGQKYVTRDDGEVTISRNSAETLLEPLIRDGEVVRDVSIEKSRERVMDERESLDE